MKKILIGSLFLAMSIFAGKFQFASGPCTLQFDTRTNRIAFDDSCYNGDYLFRLECHCLSHPNGVHDITFVFSRDEGIQLHATDIENNLVRYTASAFGRDLENGRILVCQISYNANPKEIWGRE